MLCPKDYMSTTSLFSSRKFRLSILAFTLVLAVLYDQLFWKQSAGLNVSLFTAAGLAGLGLLLEFRKRAVTTWVGLLLLPLIAFSFAAVTYNNDLAQGYMLCFSILTLLFLAVTISLSPKAEPFRILSLPVLRHPDLPFEQWGHMYRDLFRAKESEDKAIYRKIAWGIIIALPLLVIFGSLFASADAVFNSWIAQLFHFKIEPSLFWRIFRTVLMAWFLGSLLYVTLRPNYALEAPLTTGKGLDATIVNVVLGLLNVLFLAFISIQLRYLFGDWNFVLEKGLIFADYARQGFFQLVAVMALAALLLLIAQRSHHAQGRSLVLASLQLLLLSQVSVIGASALKRMYLYQSAYGFTVLRLYVEWTIYILFSLMALMALAVVLKRLTFPRLVHGSFALALLAITLVSIHNVDGLIAKKNVARFLSATQSTSTSTLDLIYLSSLSLDTLPALNTLLLQPAKIQNLSFTEKLTLVEIYDRASSTLATRDNWREWHWNDAAIKQSLKELQLQPGFQTLTTARQQDEHFGAALREVSNSVAFDPCSLLPSIGQYSYRPLGLCTFAETNSRLFILENFRGADLKSSNTKNLYTMYAKNPGVTLSANPTLLFQGELFHRPLTSNSAAFSLQKDGSVTEQNYDTRQIFRYSVVENSGKFSLEKTAL